jgi:biopolymer transport protein ExbD
MMAAPHDPAEQITGINVTPFVDVALVLLIIFMVTAKLVLQPSLALPIDLPSASTGEQTEFLVAISLTTDGAVAVNGVRADSDEAFLGHLQKQSAPPSTLKVVIQADGDIPHRRVIHVMDLLSRLGIRHIGFGVIPEAPRETP